MAGLKFSFVIPALNEEACLGACLRSIQSQADADTEIVVVDNGSRDHTASIASQMGARVVGEEQRGLSHARNRGARAASGDVVAFVDADGVLSRHWLRAARRCFADPRVGGACGLSVYIHANKLKQLWYNTYTALAAGSALASNGLLSRMIFTGNNLAMRRELFLELGGYEPVIGEGWWLSHRFWRQSRYTGRLCPGMLLWNSPRGFEYHGYLNTLLYWSRATRARASQASYTYKSR
jgi:glycosyltransferase involved in cell wall biosynthesis